MFRSTPLLLFLFLLKLGNFAQADLINDGDFELPSSAGHWTEFNVADQDFAAPGIDNTLEGAETLRAVGDDLTQVNFAGVFQDVAIGPALGIGHVVRLEGIAGHLSTDPLTLANTAYLEIAFVDASGVEFGLAPSTAIASSTPVDQYQSLSTGNVFVPIGAVAVRFKAVIRQDGGVGAAWFDNLFTTEAIPEPNSFLILATLGWCVGFRRNRS